LFPSTNCEKGGCESAEENFGRSAAELVPDWSVHTGQNKVLEDDVIFLHAQESESVERGARPSDPDA
jgi:Pheophorbide a oxygenase